MALLVLLPPSEAKRAGGSSSWNPDAGTFGAHLGDARREVARALAATDPAALGVRGKLRDHAGDVNAALIGAPTLAAHLRYTGVVCAHLDTATLSPGARRRARSSVVFVSGLAGLVGFTEQIPDYRAAMTASIAGLGPLSSFWRPHLAEVITTTSRRGPIIDLLPQTHRRSLGDLGARHLVVDLTRDGHVGGHDAKAAKGRLARALLEEGPQVLSSFRHEDWRVVVN